MASVAEHQPALTSASHSRASLLSQRTILTVVTVLLFAAVAWASLRVLAMPGAVPAAAPADTFSSARAFEHDWAISRAPHPTGSAENARVRDYLADQIADLGLQPEIQRAVVVHPALSAAFQVENVLVRLPGTASSRAVLIVGHYDSVASGLGAGDNDLSVAAMLEALRTLRARTPLRNDVIFLFSDAEEYGLLGAQAFVAKHPWARDVGVVFNYDASDGRGPLVLMHTAEEDGWLVRNLTAADSGAFLKSHQNSGRSEELGQDFDVFQAAGYATANMNNWTGQATYHTRLDNPERLDERKLQAYGVSMVRIAEHFGNLDLSQTRDADQVFTAIFDKRLVVSYPVAWTWPLTLLAVACVSAVLWAGVVRRRLHVRAVAASGAAFTGFLVAAALLAEAAWTAIKSLHPETQWQQAIEIYQGTLLLSGLLLFLLAGLVVSLSFTARRAGSINFQAAVLVIAAVVAIYGATFDPFFSYVALWPLLAVTLATGALLFIPDDGAGRHRLLRFGVFWLAAVEVLGVFVPLLSSAVIRSTETGAVVPAVFVSLLVALFAWPLEAMLPRHPQWVAGALVMGGVALLAIGAARGGFNAEQPLPHTLFYVQNADTGAAQWATLDSTRDPWLAQFVSSSARATTTDALLGLPARVEDESGWLLPTAAAWASDAQPIGEPAPMLEVLADRRDGDRRTLTLRLRSLRNARLAYLVPEGDVVQAFVAGQPIRVTPSQPLMLVGIPDGGIEITLTQRGNGPVRFVVLDQTDGLPPALAARYAPEPDDTMPAILPRWARGYAALIRTSIVFN